MLKGQHYRQQVLCWEITFFKVVLWRKPILNVANSSQLNDDESALFKKADIVMDSSGRAINKLNELLNVFGKEKFAFGTHSPILDYHTGRLRIEALKEDEADKEAKELLRGGNAKVFLGI